MIRFKVEGQLKSAVSRTRDRFLGIINVANIGVSGPTNNIGKYKIEIYNSNLKKVWREGRVENFPRHSKGPWDLLFLGLLNVVGYRNKKAIKEFLEREK